MIPYCSLACLLSTQSPCCRTLLRNIQITGWTTLAWKTAAGLDTCSYSFLLPLFTTCLSPLQTLTWDKFEETTFYLSFNNILKGVRNGIKQCKYWVGNYFSISPWPALSLPESWGKLTDSNLISWGPQEIQPKTQNPLIPWEKKKKIGINSPEGASPTHLGLHCLEFSCPVFVCILTKGQFND